MNKKIRAINKMQAAIRKFQRVDWHSVRFIPKGADEPLPPVPNQVEITPEDVEKAIADWDKNMPQYAGMLKAKVENKRDYD